MNPIYTIKHKRYKPEIQMAPLIDMVFLLLIFFMLTTTLSEQTGIDIKKPTAISSRLLPRKNIIVTLSKKDEIYLDGKKLLWEEFKNELKNKIISSPESTVVIAGDIDSKLGLAVDVMDEAKKYGAQKLAIATEYEKWEE